MPSEYSNPMAGRWCNLYKGTDAELAIEDAICTLGIPYRTQFPLFLYGNRYFPDFLLPTLQVVIEVDDSSHRRKTKMKADAERSDNMREQYGWTTLRCTNEEALRDPMGALERMLTDHGEWPLTTGIRSLKVKDFLPTVAKMARDSRRDAKSKARRRRRGTL